MRSSESWGRGAGGINEGGGCPCSGGGAAEGGGDGQPETG